MKRWMLAGALLSSTFGGVQVAHAASDAHTAASVIVRTLTPIAPGCYHATGASLWVSTTLQGRTLSAEVASFTACGGQATDATFTSAFQVPISGDSISINPHSVKLSATVPATRNSNGVVTQTTMVIDVTINDELNPHPRLEGWPGTAIGTVGSFDLAGLSWTGFPTDNEPNYAAAIIYQVTPSDNAPGPPPLSWQDVWFRPPGSGQGFCGYGPNNDPRYSETAIWDSGKQSGLAGLYVRNDPACPVSVTMMSNDLEFLAPDRTIVFAVEPGAELFLSPSDLSALGIKGFKMLVSGTSVIDPLGDLCNTGYGPADFVISGNSISPSGC